jgi:hypothetical protein
LIGSRVGPGFRSAVGKLLSDEVARSSLLNLLLDDWVGAALVSGYSTQHAAITLGVEEKLPAGTADHMAGICAGFAEDASLPSRRGCGCCRGRNVPAPSAVRHGFRG